MLKKRHWGSFQLFCTVRIDMCKLGNTTASQDLAALLVLG